MEINFLGLTISTGKKISASKEVEVIKADSEFFHRTSPCSKPIKLHPITEAIVWPNPSTDPFKQTVLNKIIADFNEAANNGYFTICPLNDAIKHFGILLTRESQNYYDQLHAVHCMKYHLMELEFVRRIPFLVTSVLSGLKFDSIDFD